MPLKIVIVAVLATILKQAKSENGLKFATQPTHQTAVLGSTVVLPCRVISGDATVQWTRDGFGLGTIRRLQGFDRYSMIGSDEEGDFSLRISPVTLEDDSVYQCQVSSKGGPKLRSRVARLTVFVPPDAPKITPSNDVSATAGVNMSIKCQSMGGRPAPEIQWIDKTEGTEFKDGIVYTERFLTDGLRLQAESTLTFTPTRLHHLHTLSCLTHNPALNEPLEAQVTLRVQFPPVIYFIQEPETLTEGMEARVTCKTEANPSIVRYKWIRRSKVILGANGPSLNLGVLTKEDHGSAIACEATNDIGTIRQTQSLDVKYAPRFQSAPESESADSNTEVTLRCDVEGNPQPEITWRHIESNMNVGKGKFLKLIASERTKGTYVCTALSRGYSTLEGRVKLRLRGPPVISANNLVKVQVSKAALLKCSAKAVPHPLAITWSRNGVTINPEINGRILISEEQRADGVTSTLRINSTEEQDFAAYNCSVVNEYGIDVHQIILQKEVAIPMIIIVSGGFGGIAIVTIIILFIVCGRKPKTSTDTSHEKARNGTEHPTPKVAINHCSPVKSIHSPNQIIKCNTSTGIPVLLGPNVNNSSSGCLSDNESETKDGNRTESSLSAIERDSEGWMVNQQTNSVYPCTTSSHYSQYTPSAILSVQNNSYFPSHSEYGRSYFPINSNPRHNSTFKLNESFIHAHARPTFTTSSPATVAPPPYSPSPNGLVGVNGFTSKILSHSPLNISSGSRLTHGLPEIHNFPLNNEFQPVSSSSQNSLQHDLLADIQQPDLMAGAGIHIRTESISLTDRPSIKSTNYQSKFIMPSEANYKPGTLV